MAKTSDGTFTHVRGELAWTIAEHRSPSEAIAMTKHLTDADEGRFELLGLVEDCEVALYWDHIWRVLVRAAFDADGVEDLVDAESVETGYPGRSDYLKNAELEEWDLVHPRHQWLIK
ncbi:hypothetical protein [Halobaculum sp. EA56]|uniref:hypothetical protein n=1 Tax=Halobaculum sp. EA56 TaxID=3421648 RepID=UPI003EC0B5A7